MAMLLLNKIMQGRKDKNYKSGEDDFGVLYNLSLKVGLERPLPFSQL